MGNPYPLCTYNCWLMNTYANLQQSIDKVIGKIGLQRTIDLLESFLKGITVQKKETEKLKLIFAYLVASAAKCYDLTEDQLFNETSQEAKDARMICYHLLHKYGHFSYQKIGDKFKQPKRTVMYYSLKAGEYLTIPGSYKELMQKYTAIENELIEFIGKMQ